MTLIPVKNKNLIEANHIPGSARLPITPLNAPRIEPGASECRRDELGRVTRSKNAWTAKCLNGLCFKKPGDCDYKTGHQHNVLHKTIPGVSSQHA